MSDFSYTCKNGRDLIIRFGHDDQISVFDPSGTKVGYVDHTPLDEDHRGSEYVLITHVEIVPEWRGQGAMAQAVRLLVQEFGYRVYARAHDGQRRPDGSHLVGDGPWFFDALEKQGLIARVR